MPHDPAKVVTAEEYLEDLREMMVSKIETGEILRGLYPRASEQQQIRMMGPLDEAQEAERLLAAFAVARNFLATEHLDPHHDETPPRSNGRRSKP